MRGGCYLNFFMFFYFIFFGLYFSGDVVLIWAQRDAVLEGVESDIDVSFGEGGSGWAGDKFAILSTGSLLCGELSSPVLYDG